jgi:hypothetical protein
MQYSNGDHHVLVQEIIIENPRIISTSIKNVDCDAVIFTAKVELEDADKNHFTGWVRFVVTAMVQN